MGLRKRNSFTIDSFNDLLDDIIQKRVSASTAERAIVYYLESEEFMRMLFNPPEEIDRAKLQKDTKDMYVMMAHRKVIKTTVNAIEEEAYNGYDEFDRSVATFLHTVALAGIQVSQEFEDRTRSDLEKGNISRSEAREEMIHINKYNDNLKDLIKTAMKIIKRRAKRISYDSNMPVEICRSAFLGVPDPKYINKYQVGFYANRVLTDIYEIVDSYEVNLDRVKWGRFFSQIMGESNVVEVATYILLEGMNRINDFKGSEVKKVWNSLTTFALDVLEDAPEQIQTQMLDLYTKRISRMFNDNVYELRADLRNLDEAEYPNLAHVVSGYVDKINEIIKEAADKAKDKV